MSGADTVTAETAATERPMQWAIASPEGRIEQIEQSPSEAQAELRKLVPGKWWVKWFFESVNALPVFTNAGGLTVQYLDPHIGWTVNLHGRRYYAGARFLAAKTPAVALRVALVDLTSKLRMAAELADAIDGVQKGSTFSLRSIAERVRTQDGRCTADPYFVVERLVRDYDVEAGEREYFEYDDMDPGDDVDTGTLELLEQFFCDHGEPQAPYTAFKGPDGSLYGFRYYRERWERIQAFLTEEAADRWVDRQCHNYRLGLRVYAESASRNLELRRVRQLFRLLGEVGA